MSCEMIVRGFTGGAFVQNAYLVTCAETGGGILVDPGAAVGDMLEVVRRDGVEVSAIVLTHAHLDHVEGVAKARRETGAPILLHPADLPLYEAAPEQAQMFGLSIEALPPVDRLIELDEEIAVGDCTLRVREAPGHAPGHIILLGDGLALVGDCVFNGSIGRTDLAGGDLGTLMRSIRAEILTLPEETTLYSGHGPETTVGHERATNPFLVPNLGGSTFA